MDSTNFPRMAVPDDEPDLAIGEDPLWDLLISMKSGKRQGLNLSWRERTFAEDRMGSMSPLQ